MVVAIDARRREQGGWEVYTHGGRRELAATRLNGPMRAERLGAGEILLTSMDCDGTREGYDIELTRASRVPCEFP